MGKFLLPFLILISFKAQARVFNISESNFATYFGGSFGTSALQKHPYDKTSGTQTEFSTETDFNWGGELGFLFPAKEYSFRIGITAISPHIPGNINGKKSDGTQLMTLDSSVLGLFPIAHLEYYVAKNNLGRAYISLGGGFGKVSIRNEYQFTTAGDTTYSPLTSFSERASQYTYLVETSIGYEMPFVHAGTLCFDFGYRYSVAKDLKYEDTGTNFIGSHTSGDTVVDSSGNHKTLDLGGVFTGLSFRFYFD